MSLKRVLFVHNVYREKGGEEMAVDMLENALRQNGWSTARYERRSADFDHQSWLQKTRQAVQIVFSIDTFLDVDREIREFKPDLLHVHNLFPLITPSVYWAAFRHHIPVVQTLHNYRVLCVNGLLRQKGMACERCLHGNMAHAVWGRCQRTFFRSVLTAINLLVHRSVGTWRTKVDAFIALSHFSKIKFVEGGLPEDKIHVLPNWMDVSSLPFNPRGGESNIVFLGRLSQEKGILTLLKAHTLFSKTRPDVLLHIVGDGPLAADVTTYIKRHPEQKVVYHGRLEGEQKIRMLSNATALVFPSECYENCPYTILESLAVGTPVLVSGTGGIPELVDEGKTGFSFSPGSVESLAECVLRYFQIPDQWPLFRQQAREKALRCFDKQKGVERLEHLFAMLIRRPI